MNEYDAIIQDGALNDVRQSVAQVADTNPDTEAKLRSLATQYNLPVEAVRLQQPEVETQAKIDSLNYEDIVKNFPSTGRFLSDPNNAAIAHDDVENLTTLERTLGFGKNAAKSVLGGLAGIGSSVAGFGRAGGDILTGSVDTLNQLGIYGNDPIPNELGPIVSKTFANLQQNQDALQKRFTPEASGNIESGIYSGIQSLTQNVPTMFAGAMTGRPDIALTAMAALTGGQSYGRAKDSGINTPSALAYAGADAAVEYGTELLPVARLFSDLKVGSGFFSMLAHQALLEVPGEQVATVLQDFNEWSVLHPEQTLNDYAQARPGAAVQTLVATLVGTGGNVALVKAVGAVNAMSADARDAKSAELAGKTLDHINELVNASKVVNRSPEALKELVKTATEDGAKNFYINAQVLNQSGVADRLAALVPSVSEQLAEASVTGGEVEIPIADYVAHVANSDIAAQLVDHIRVEGENYTRAEAQDYLATEGDRLQQDVENIVNQNGLDSTFADSANAVKATVKGKLNDANHFNDATNDAYASLVSNYYATQASRLGTTPDALFQAHPLNVTSALQSGQSFNQSLPDKIYINAKPYHTLNSMGQPIHTTQEGIENFYKWFGKSKAVDSEGRPIVLFHGSPHEFSSFNLDKMGTNGTSEGHGFYFTPDEKIAKGYGDNGKVYPVYLSLGDTYSDKKRTITKAQIKKILSELHKADPDFALSNYGDINFEGLNKVLNEATDMENEAQDDADIVGSLINAGVGTAENVFKALNKVTKKTGVITAWVDSKGNKGPEIYVVNNPNQIKSATENSGEFNPNDTNIYNQKARGTFNPATNTISLLKNADFTTFLHETGHFFLETQVRIASELQNKTDLSEGEKSLLSDTQALLKWFGVSDLNAWFNLSFEQQRPFHEQFAEGFEKYLAEGKAPSIEISPVFTKFKRWILGFYKDIRRMMIQLTPEVRSVMDRLIATEDQIELAARARSMIPLFESAAAGQMTELQFGDYQQLGDEWLSKALEKLGSKAYTDMQWLSNARSKSLKAMQKKHDALRRDVRAQVRINVMGRPVYQAWSFLTGKLSEDDKIKTVKTTKSKHADSSVDSLFTAIAKFGGLDKKSIQEEWGIDPATKSPTPVFGKHVFKSNGLTIDDMGEKLLNEGYLTPDFAGKFDQREFEEKFGAELRGDIQYSNNVDASIFQPEPRPGEQINTSGLGAGRLELESLKQMFLVPEQIDHLVKLKMTARDGLHPDIVADIIPGFSSGSEMLDALIVAEPPKSVIERETDQRMLELHGELATPEAIKEAADKAIYTAARAKMVSRESDALNDALGKKKVLNAAAKDYAEQMIAKLKIRDISPQKYIRAASKAARNAADAVRNPDKGLPIAAAEKRNELLNTHAANAAYRAQDQVDKMLRYFKRFDKPSATIDADYMDQIQALLSKFDLRKQSNTATDRQALLKKWVMGQLKQGNIPPIAETLLNKTERAAYLSEVQSRDENGDLVYPNDEQQIELLAAAIDRSEARPYKEATVEELNGLYETIKFIEHLGRLKNRLVTDEEKRALDDIKNDIAGVIAQFGGDGGKNVRSPNDVLGKSLRSIKGFGAAHIKVATWARQMDGGIDAGPVWKYMVYPANVRASKETTARSEATKALHAILDPVLSKRSIQDKAGKGQFFPSIGTSLNWQERFTMLLNMGNESNLQRLLDGGIAGVANQLTIRQVHDVIGTLSPDEIQAAQSVWDHIETYRPQVEETMKRVTGTTFKKILARELKVRANDGTVVTLAGGYYPVKYDTGANSKAQQDLIEQESKQSVRATVTKSFTKERVDEVHGRPLSLSLRGLYSGVNDTIHYINWLDWQVDMNKLLSPNGRIDKAIREYYGPEVLHEFKQWRDDIVAGQRRLDHQIEKAAGFFRQNVAASALSFNLVSAAMQPLGISNSIARVGAEWVGKGVARFVVSPIKSGKQAMGKSEWMRNRALTRFRELNELRNVVEGQNGFKQFMGKYGYFLMQKMQLTVDIPTWWAGYEKAISEGHDEKIAVGLADQGVKDSQGGGEEVDQSGIERGGALTKLFTAFYGFMGTTLNTAYGSTVSESSKAKIAANLLLSLSVPAVLAALLRAALVGGDDGEKDWINKLAREQISFLFGLLAFGREFSQLFNQKSMGYSGPTGLRLIPDTFNLVQQAKQGEFDEAFRKQFVNIVGDLTGIPAVQINRSIGGIEAVAQGKTKNPIEAAQAIGFGFK